MTRRTYLDYNATAPLKPAVADAVRQALLIGGNPSSVHHWGRAARQVLEEARRHVAVAVNAKPSQVIFTSGGTEANALALHGVSAARILASAIEHPSIVSERCPVERLPVTADGVLALDGLDRVLNESRSDRPAMIAVMLANNETGVVQPMADVVHLARAAGALVHCDAVQGFGKMAIDFSALGVDTLSLSAHKIGAPSGVGALVVRDGLALNAQQMGGGQELRRRAGTENVAGIAGFGAAAALVGADLGRAPLWAEWRDWLEARITAIAPDVRIFGKGVARLPNTSCFATPNVRGETQVMALDLSGIGVSSGAACSSGKVERSRVLDAMGVSPSESACAIRVSMGWNTKADDIDHFVEAWDALWQRTRLSSRQAQVAA